MQVLNKQSSHGLKIQNRDLEILEFCLEMKFSDLETLNWKYFDASSEMFAARKRIQKLEGCGFLKSAMMLPGTTKKFFVTTKKGTTELEKLDNKKITLGVLTKLSDVTFQHDYGVLKIRKLLEQQQRATNWKSEKLLKAIAKYTTGKLNRYFLPDALFTSKQGKIVALEFENKPKKENDLREKILRLNAVMESQEPAFSGCLFVASTANLKVKIQSITELFPGKFIVQSMSEIENVKV